MTTCGGDARQQLQCGRRPVPAIQARPILGRFQFHDRPHLAGDTARMTLAEATSQFLFHCRYEKNLNQKTLKAYGTDLRQMDEFLARGRETDAVTLIDKSQLREYIRHLHTVLAERSLKRKVATMK